MNRVALSPLIAAVALTLGSSLGACGSGDGEQPAGDGAAGSEVTEQPRSREGPRPDPLAGAERIVFIGDSLAVAGERPYPARLAGELGRPLEVSNLAEAGTTTEEWLPGGELFETRLRPALAGADAVLVSVGGTDLERALLGSDALDALDRAAEAGGAAATAAAFGRIERNLDRTFAAIEEANPGAAIVFVGYPDYSSSADWQARAGRLGAIALRTALASFGPLAEHAGADEAIEMLAATGPEVDALLSDGEHLNDAGHQLYAEEIAARLGGF